jgi:hypothetical protein
LEIERIVEIPSKSEENAMLMVMDVDWKRGG